MLCPVTAHWKILLLKVELIFDLDAFLGIRAKNFKYFCTRTVLQEICRGEMHRPNLLNSS